MNFSNLRKYAILCSTLVLCGMLFVFLHNLKPEFDKVEQDYREKMSVNLSAKTLKDSKTLSNILVNNGYITDKKDADYIADTLVERVKRLKYPNLYHLQKRDYGKVPMLVADSAGVLTEKVEISNSLIGLSDSLPSPYSLASSLDRKDGDGELKVIIKSNGDSNRVDVIVRVEEHYLQADSAISALLGYVKTDSNGVAIVQGLNREKGYSVLPIRRGYEYGRAKGIVCGHFDKYKYFHRFGKKKYVFTFEQIEHRIQMIDNGTLKQIKNDGTLTVRTPSEYKISVIRWFVLVLLGWWVLCFVLIRRKKNFDPLMIAAAMFLTGFCVLMMFSIQNPLTEELRGVDMAKGVLMGLCVTIVLQYVDFVKLYQGKYKVGFDPIQSLLSSSISTTWPFLPFKQKVKSLAQILLDKKKNGLQKAIACTAIGLCFLLHVVIYFLRWLLMPFKCKVKWLTQVLVDKDRSTLLKTIALIAILVLIPFLIVDILMILPIRLIQKGPKGSGWLLIALIITALLWSPLGQSIGGMKVNLRLGGLTFQPSEVAKYLIVFFMAAFFTQHADSIINYSRPAKKRLKDNLWGKTKTLSWVIGGLLVLMGMYALLGDMGPGLVIGVTFVLLYSLVKSKVNLDNLPEDDKWHRIFTCDFAMLIYGVMSFAAFIVAGSLIGDAMIGAILWFIAWIFFGWSRHKQFFETAVIMNLLVFLIIFGGQVMQKIPFLAGSDTAERFEQRTKMCVNTWGNLDIAFGGANAEAVSNTQVANGLWGLATGGMTGQGLGDGNSNLIPAFHTDMILSSIGEQLGWIGLLVVVLVLALLLRRMIVVGYKVGHPFAFYFCTGVAIVTGVQFFIIALGSSGIIPLTGITVPFLSYGRVSIILNLIAFGIVLSFSQNIKETQIDIVVEKVRQRSVGDYNYPVSIIHWTFIMLALFTLGVWQYYCFWNRGNTLVHPAFVYNKEGTPIIEYNPRIALLAKGMWAGDIYDRNGVLLATSDRDKIKPEKYVEYGLKETDINNIVQSHQKRYYPFGPHLFFMLGDQNSGLYFTYNEDNPIGYMAEAQHLAYLRDYDNVMRDKNGNPVKVYLKDRTITGGRFVDGIERDTTLRYVVHDNSDLIRYLKSGIHGRELKKHNNKVMHGKYDLHLTLDAVLQTKMQKSINDYVESTPALKNNNMLRISVVVLDAQNGDLLTSANYPLPDYQRLRDEEELARTMGKKYAVYSDYYKDEKWKAYTDRDLGLTFQTMPGSTAKVMSAMAGLQKIGTSAADKKYTITKDEIIEKGSALEPYGLVTMRDAIVKSSNCYFINLVNDNNLYWNLDSIYETVGVRIDKITPYTFMYNIDDVKRGKFRNNIKEVEDKAINSYKRYKERGVHRKMNNAEWQWAWGQGTINASPLNMARIASAVVNDGVMPTTQYVIPHNSKTKKMRIEKDVRLLKKNEVQILQRYMYEEASNQKNRNGVILPSCVGGKTGTPERNWYQTKRSKPQRKNDGWYMFYVNGSSCKDNHPLAVAVRMERGPGSGSAVRLTKSEILKVLYECGYINQR